MLKPELARQQLEKLKSKKHADGRLNRIRKLPKAQLHTALAVVGRLENGEYPNDWQEREKLKRRAVSAITDDTKLRGRILQAFYPTLHEQVEAGWQVLSRL